jgi:hypothetical protein
MYYLCFCLFAHSGVQNILPICGIWRVSYKRQEMMALHELVGSPRGFPRVCVADLFNFL